MMTKTNRPQESADQGRQQYQSGEYLAAAASFAQAASLYGSARDELLAAEMKNNQSVALLRAKLPEQALEAARGTEAVFSAAGDAGRMGMALANQASAFEALHRRGEAIQFYCRAGESLDQAGESDLHLQVMQLLSALYLRKFKFFDAIASLQSGLAGVKDPSPRQRLMKKLLFIHF